MGTVQICCYTLREDNSFITLYQCNNTWCVLKISLVCLQVVERTPTPRSFELCTRQDGGDALLDARCFIWATTFIRTYYAHKALYICIDIRWHLRQLQHLRREQPPHPSNGKVSIYIFMWDRVILTTNMLLDILILEQPNLLFSLMKP
jgi:hypothetical protein